MNEIELEERLFNIEDGVIALRKEMIEYMEKNPKCEDQWIEMRLRALEHQIKCLTFVKTKE